MKDSEKKTLKSVLKSTLFDGLLLIALGIVVIIWPDGAFKTLCIVIGVIIAAMGLIRGIVYFVNKNGDHSAWDPFLGIVQIAIGVALIVTADFFVKWFFIIAGVLLLYGALMMFIQAIRLRGNLKLLVLAIVFGCLTLALGVIILLNPASFANFIAILQGISLIIEGIGMIIVSATMKRIAK